MTPAPT